MAAKTFVKFVQRHDGQGYGVDK